MTTKMEDSDKAFSVENLRELFRRVSAVQNELQRLNYDMFQQFKEENSKISDLEFYNLKKVIKREDYKSIDTLEMRRSLLKKWEGELGRMKSEE